MKKVRDIISEEIKKAFNILEYGNIPMGAQYDSKGPWAEKDSIIKKGFKPSIRDFETVFLNNEIAILKKDNKYYAFYYSDFDDDDLGEYADRETEFHGFDEDGEPITDFVGDIEIDGDVIENFVNDNYDSFVYGKGLSDWENGAQMVELDDALINDLESTYEINLGFLKS